MKLKSDYKTMSNEEILKKAIEKAEKNGFYFPGNKGIYIESEITWYSIIFDHDFAKAFWNKNKYGWTKEKVEEAKRNYPNARIAEWGSLDSDNDWQYHLQQMVLEEDPITYLSKYL